VAKCHPKNTIDGNSGFTCLGSLGSPTTNGVAPFCFHSAKGTKVSIETVASIFGRVTSPVEINYLAISTVHEL